MEKQIKQKTETTVQTKAEIKEKNQEEQTVQTMTAPKTRTRLDENMLVPIASGVHGGLTYESSRSGQVWKFYQYGDEDVMELREVRTMLSSARKFLQKGWIRILDDEIIEYLNLQRLQQDVISPEYLDDLFNMSPEQVLELVKNANSNAKRLIFGIAKEKYINGELVNVHVIKAIEEGLGEQLDPNI